MNRDLAIPPVYDFGDGKGVVVLTSLPASFAYGGNDHVGTAQVLLCFLPAPGLIISGKFDGVPQDIPLSMMGGEQAFTYYV